MRPGEQFKTKKATTRRGQAPACLEPLAADEMEPANGNGDATEPTEADPSTKVGAAACVQVKLNRRKAATCDVSQPLVLRTPKDARHLVS